MSTASLTSDLVARPARNAARHPVNANCDGRTQGPVFPGRRSNRRGLVLTDESAGHPFRAALPPHVKRDLHDIPAESLWALTRDDVRGAASVYFAATAGVLAFIA